jgi:hypothetical protein
MRGNSQQFSATSVPFCPPLRTRKAKNLRRGKVPTNAGKAANNRFRFGRVDIPYNTCCNPKWSGLYMHGKLSISSTHLMQIERMILSLAFHARFSHDVISREMPVPNMTVSRITFLLALRAPSNYSNSK